MRAFLGYREDFSNSLMPLSSSCRHHQPLPSYYAKNQQKNGSKNLPLVFIATKVHSDIIWQL